MICAARIIVLVALLGGTEITWEEVKSEAIAVGVAMAEENERTYMAGGAGIEKPYISFNAGKVEAEAEVVVAFEEGRIQDTEAGA